MVKYYYDKYNTMEAQVWRESDFQPSGELSYVFMNNSKSYTFDKVNNTFNFSDERWGSSESVPVGAYAFSAEGPILLRYEAKQSTNANAGTLSTRMSKNTNDSIRVPEYSRGSLVQSNIVAEDGTYPTNWRHTDGFWYVRKGVANQNPVVTPVGTVPSGSMSVKPSFNYKVTDPDGNTMTVTESIDGIAFNTRTSVASGTQLTFTPTDLAWLRTRIKQAIDITITANDGKGGVTTVNYPITRTTPAIDLQIKAPFETDVAAKRLLLKLEGNIPSDANVSVQACNNAFDTSPTWENATNLVLSGFPYLFTNKTKTATKWGVSFKVRIERGSSTQPINLDYLGGAFD